MGKLVDKETQVALTEIENFKKNECPKCDFNLTDYCAMSHNEIKECILMNQNPEVDTEQLEAEDLTNIPVDESNA